MQIGFFADEHTFDACHLRKIFAGSRTKPIPPRGSPWAPKHRSRLCSGCSRRSSQRWHRQAPGALGRLGPAGRAWVCPTSGAEHQASISLFSALGGNSRARVLLDAAHRLECGDKRTGPRWAGQRGVEVQRVVQQRFPRAARKVHPK